MMEQPSPSAAPFDILQWLRPETAAAFGHFARVRRYEHGQMLYAQGDASTDMYRLVSGSIRLSASRSDGREILYLLFEPGDCFGDSSLIDGDARPQSAEAQGAVSVQILTQEAYRQLKAAHPDFDQGLLHLFSRQMRLLIGYLADVHLQDLPSRVASRIVAAARSFGVETAGGTRLSIRLSQSELAMMVGASRQSVNKVLQQFQAEGLILTEYGNVVVRDLPGLRARFE
jgi:CRP/FNR family cyclic AMP-dependent transcriptional regulator